MSNGPDRTTVHMEACSGLVGRLEYATHPDSPGGREITPEEWSEVVDEAKGQVLRGAQELVILKHVHQNLDHRGLEYVLTGELPVQKNILYQVLRYLGFIDPGRGRHAKQEAPSRYSSAGAYSDETKAS
jgi:hypothetical protein